MAQLNWTYTSDRGQRYVVGMYHGQQSGHFMVYCNSKVILIDFNVKKASSYSFFIENELLEIKINETEKSGYSYDFVMNTEVETPLNQERKKVNNKHFVWGLVGFVLFALTVFGGYKVLDNRNDRYLKANKKMILKEKGLLTTARVALEPTDGDEMKMTYAFISNGKAREFQQNISLLSAGLLPVRSGDQFKITFLPDHPEIHDLHLSKPHRKTMERFSELVLNKIMALHPQLSEKEAACILSSSIESHGTAGMADLFYQNLTEEEHPAHNYETFQKLVNSKDFREAVEMNCSLVVW